MPTGVSPQRGPDVGAPSAAPAGALQLSAWVALAGIAAFTAAVLTLHGLQPALSPAKEAISFYVHGAHGWLLTAGLLALGLGSLCLTAGLARSVRGTTAARAGRWCLGVWGVGVLLGGIFPADPPGNWGAPPSAAGLVHGNAALAAFAALPAAAVLLSRAFRRDPDWRRVAATSSALAAAAVVSLTLFLASLAPAIVSPGPPVLLGLTERVLVAVYLAWLALVAGMLRSRFRSASAERIDPPAPFTRAPAACTTPPRSGRRWRRGSRR